MTGIFVAYRQSDANAWAVLLRDELARAFGNEHVFLDKDSLHAGNWREQIHAALDRCRAVIVVIGPDWLRTAGTDGRMSLHDPQDVHRQEIEMALARSEISVIPVLVDGATPPSAEDLPGPLRALADLQARRLADSDAHRRVDLDLIVADIERAGVVPLAVPQRGPMRVLEWLGRLARRLVYAFAASLVLLVLAEVALGWNLSGTERALVVFFVLVATLAVSAVRGRRRRDRRAPV